MNLNVILWDFDGTLAHRDGMWSGALTSLAQQIYPENEVTADAIRPHLQSGFPWHSPEADYGQRSSEQWWSDLEPVFYNAYRNAGLPHEYSMRLSQSVRNEYTQSENWAVYDDVEDCLSGLISKGWQHHILSNHVPELPKLVRALGLGDYFKQIFTSAKIGFEKPNESIFKHVLSTLPKKCNVWMVGDSYAADILSAETVGIPAILVRKQHHSAKYSCPSLAGVSGIVNQRTFQQNG